MRLLAVLLAAVASGQTITTLIGSGKPGLDANSVNNPYGLIIGPDKALYFCEIDNHAVRRLDLKTKQVTSVATGQQPYEVRFDAAGNLYFVDMPAHVVRRVDRKTKAVTTVAGTGQAGFSGDGGPAIKAELKQPHSIAFDRDGALLICDIGNHRVRRVDKKSGVISTLLGTGERKPTPDGAKVAGTPFNGPRAIEVDRDGTLYLALREGNAVYSIDRKADRVTHIAGTGEKGMTGDNGPATQAKLNGPKGISLSRDRKLFLADTENHAIRAIDLKTGVVTTVAGSGERGDGPEGDPLKCKMNRPHGIFAGADGTLFIADSEAHRIRVVR
ncbi:MAG: SMP-30/gluconolactonase/LRE family protein [Bryobacteraceae bacterium]|nr:SMP-30/gluconolactonase/LRE family protein [Bryobacteraceae bacterium]